MYDTHSKGISYTSGFFILVAMAIAGQIFASLVSISIWQSMTGLGFKEMADNMNNPAYADAMKVMQAIGAIAGFFLPALATAALLNRKPLRLLGFSRRISSQQVGLAVLIIATSLIVSTSLSYFNHLIPLPETWRVKVDFWEKDYTQRVEAIIDLKSPLDYIIALIVMGFLPAFCEETLFRGGLQNFLSRGTGKPWLSIVIVSIIFSLAHISFFGFLSRFFLGVVLGAIFYYSGKLWLSILAHFINNAIALTVLYVYASEGKPVQEAMNSDASTGWGILVLLIVVSLFVLFKKLSAANRAAE